MTTNAFPFVLPITPPTFSIRELDPGRSSLTGKNLRRCGVSFTVAGEDRNDLVNAALDAAANATQLISDTNGNRWKVGSRRVSYQQGSAMYNHYVELEEQEDLQLTGVEMDGMTLVPERSKFQPQGDMLTFMVSLGRDDNERFEQILERHRTSETEVYFEVRLVGVSDEQEQWRFGQCLWQSLGNGGARHQVVLIPKAYDEAYDDKIPDLYQPERMRVQQQSVLTKLRLDALVAELQRAGVLDVAAVGRINAEPELLPFAEVHEFERADNVDEFFL